MDTCSARQTGSPFARRRVPAVGSVLLIAAFVAAVACLVSGREAEAAGDAGNSKAPIDEQVLDRVTQRAEDLPRLHALIVAHEGTVLLERAFRGPGLDVPVNVKSAAKSVVSALAGIAMDRGLIEGADQPMLPLLGRPAPANADPRLDRVTVGNLLSMQAGLERTSGGNYGRWVQSRDWVGFALSRPFVDEPGGRMLYSTGNTHLLSAMLTEVSGRSTLEIAREWLTGPLGVDLPPWDRDPQGIYFGGNNMLLSPRALLRFGEMYRNGGVFEGERVVSEDWIRKSWTPRTTSRYSGDGYGYGWFIADICGRPVYYARGFGGQFLYVAPSLGLTIVITSEETTRTRVDGYYEALRALVADEIVPAALRAQRATPGGAGTRETGTGEARTGGPQQACLA
ncbi:MAG: serine hydrolase [Rhodospirillaceae bacterium]